MELRDGGYRWLLDTFTDGAGATDLYVFFVRGLPPGEVTRRLAAAGITVGETAEVVAADGGSAVFDWSFEEEEKVAAALTPGTVAALVHTNVNLDEDFTYAADGCLITTFAPGFPGDRSGERPDALNAELREVGLLPVVEDEYDEEGLLKALSLAERVTGVRLTLAHLADLI
ncbi:DUF6461 domain-containing protein [Bailinhaonella thermotolerans]|uniref:Uncharacterized protein n=1 Tax=Bailinhaonella thermotolerans TaxID=1070861 RepID=A0A3A4A4R5_9ACTN|nr:DUF6461 domain-containing protein [Bailinhaonella thermotolerans]RJL22801.1 hypothetical protein D5H75_35055 [Bailinhaonella thermotolerans]